MPVNEPCPRCAWWEATLNEKQVELATCRDLARRATSTGAKNSEVAEAVSSLLRILTDEAPVAVSIPPIEERER